MTLTDIASSAPEDSEKRVRNQANARQAYDEVSRISRRTGLLESERKDVEAKLAELRSALQELGDKIA
jgi:chaperonin cofactor prefoldin